MPASLVAIDVAILVPDAVAGPAAEISRGLAGDRPDALRLDGRHLAHITLAQQFVERARLDELFAELDRILRHEPAVPLRASGAAADRGTIVLAIEPAPDLQRLHEMVMDVTEPFESPEGGAAAFRADGETIRARDVDWVRNYREHSAYQHYNPHVTLGHGARTPAFAPVEFHADRVAACELGRFCTCRAVLREWRLGAGGAGTPEQRRG